jgi:phospholipase/carboxylesterase
MLKLGRLMPDSVTLVAPRGPISVGTGWTWFDNKGIGRPRESSIKESAAALLAWLDEVAEAHSRIVLLGFSGGTAMAGGLLFTDPDRFAGAVLLSGTLPWDAGFEAPEGLLSGMPVFWSIDPEDRIIPADLAARSHAWLVEHSGADVQEHLYPGVGHGISQQEAEDVAAFVGGLSQH